VKKEKFSQKEFDERVTMTKLKKVGLGKQKQGKILKFLK
jgi:hypothetical protein